MSFDSTCTPILLDNGVTNPRSNWLRSFGRRPLYADRRGCSSDAPYWEIARLITSCQILTDVVARLREQLNYTRVKTGHHGETPERVDTSNITLGLKAVGRPSHSRGVGV
jgi:hypothetical protein